MILSVRNAHPMLDNTPASDCMKHSSAPLVTPTTHSAKMCAEQTESTIPNEFSETADIADSPQPYNTRVCLMAPLSVSMDYDFSQDEI